MTKQVFLRRFRSYLFLSLLLFILSCSVGSDYKSPQITLPKEYNNENQTNNAKIDYELISSYNKAYTNFLDHFKKDETLKLLISIQKQNNFSLKTNLFTIEEYLKMYDLSLRQNLPGFELSATLQKRKRSEAIASAIQQPYFDFISIGTTLSWEIDLFGRLRRLNEARRAEVEEQFELARDTELFLMHELLASYVNYRNLEETKSLIGNKLNLKQQNFKLIEKTFNQGLESKVTYLNTKNEFQALKLNLSDINISLEEVKNSIATLLGVYPKKLNSLLSAPNKMTAISNLSLNFDRLNILLSRPDIRAKERKLKAMHSLISVAKADYYPRLSLVGSLRFEALNLIERAFLKKAQAYALGPSIDWSILNFDIIKKQVELQDIRYQKAFFDYKQTIVNAVAEVETAYSNFKEQYFKYLTLKDMYNSQVKVNNLNKKLYDTGLRSFREFLVTKEILIDRELNFKLSESNLRKAYFSLCKSIGVG